MKEVLLGRIRSKLNHTEQIDCKLFCKKKSSQLTQLFVYKSLDQILDDPLVSVEPMQHTSELSSILGQLLVKTDKVKIMINEEVLQKISIENNLNYNLIREKIILHEYLHYVAYKNKISLEYKPRKFLSRKVRETEELIINDIIDCYINDDFTIYDLYRLI